MFNWHSLTDTEDWDNHVREMPRRFGSCFMMLQTANGNKYPVQYRRHTDTGHEFVSGKYGAIHLNMETDATVEPVFPETGLYVIEKILYYFAKKPNRQWKRGVCDGNAQLINLESGMKEPIREDKYNICANSIVSPFSYSTTLLFDRAMIFDREWGVTRRGDVFYKDTQVGNLVRNADTNIVLSVNELLYQEAVDRFGKEFKWQIRSVPA